MKFNLSEKESFVWEHIKHIFSFAFQTLLFLFLVLLLLREFYPNLVNNYLNINWFMVVVIVFGALSIIFPPAREEVHREEKVTRKDIILIVGLGILGGIIIGLKINNFGWIGYVISVLGGLIIMLLSWFLLNERNDDQPENLNTFG